MNRSPLHLPARQTGIFTAIVLVMVAATVTAMFLAWPAAAASPRPSPNLGWMLGPFERVAGEPIVSPDPGPVFLDPVSGRQVHWEALHTFNPAAVVREGMVDLLYRAEDDTGKMDIGMHTSRLGLAESADGIHFVARANPVFYATTDSQEPREWPGGVEDPRIVEREDGLYVLTYTQWNRKTYTVGIATSRDLLHWTKYGPAFAGAAGGRYDHLRYKSAGIVTRLAGDRLIAARIRGRFWMYWGEIQIRLATSPDLIHWTPVEGSPGQPIVLLTGRAGLFDSAFPEVGPPPLLTAHGILLLYNGKNAESGGAPGIGPGAYSGGQALFSAKDPTRLLERARKPYFQPELGFERSGQYAAGTTFTEGLVFFRAKWFLYYGAADSYVGVGVCDAPGGD